MEILMGKKFLSLVIIPHKKGKHKTISFSEKKFKVLVGVGSLFFIAALVFFIDYFSMNDLRQKYGDLTKESLGQKETLVQYEKTISKLKGTIEDFESYVKKLNIMAGLKSSEGLNEFGIGSGNSDQEINPMSIPQEVNLSRMKKIEQKAEGIEKNLNTLVHFFESESLRLAGTPSIWPTKGYMSSAYGWREDPFTQKRTFHWGIDIATHYGNPVFATADGIVIQRENGKIGGRTVKISHRGGYTTIYCHLSKFLVKPGQRVKRGDVIGLIGKSGKAIGPHVHYEIKLSGKNQNPWYYILEE